MLAVFSIDFAIILQFLSILCHILLHKSNLWFSTERFVLCVTVVACGILFTSRVGFFATYFIICCDFFMYICKYS